MKESKYSCDVVFNDFEQNVRSLFSTEHIINCFRAGNFKRYKEICSNANIISIFEDVEMIKTIECFFENNLNISQTSKKSFMHRNTLIYRIEKVKKLTGLNLKNFDDSVIFSNLQTVKKFFD